jgi:formylglycine-generating enzyme required for sulfatase activity
MFRKINFIVLFLLLTVNITAQRKGVKSCCIKNIPSRFTTPSILIDTITKNKGIDGMVWIPSGEFMMGGDNAQARRDEFPRHKVRLSGFYMDATEVTNKQFELFVDATHYVTTAERYVDWEQMKKQFPEGTEKPDSSILEPASLVFTPTTEPVALTDYSQWWQWKKGANWRHPLGPESDIVGKENDPVVQVSWDDAIAYCKWAGKRLPTEAEWEYAARGGKSNVLYAWGNAPVDSGKPQCNFWQGSFPNQNLETDTYVRRSPVKSFQPNAIGLYDMSGNVWEWCSDWYNNVYYQSCAKNKISINPKGPKKSYDPDDPLIAKRVMRGGSFLCNESYCSGYRCASRMKSSPDTGMEHVGFRCVKDK